MILESLRGSYEGQNEKGEGPKASWDCQWTANNDNSACQDGKNDKYSEKIICYLICVAGVAQSIGDWRVASTDHSKEPAHLLCTDEVLSVVVFRSISVKLE